MKRLTYLFTLCLFLAGGLVSCVDTSFDETFLVGKWQTPSNADTTKNLYYVYYNNGEGKTWDEGEDVNENDLTYHGNGWFTWELQKSDLQHIYLMENGGAEIPKVYTVTVLNASVLQYKDDFGKSYSFKKVK